MCIGVFLPLIFGTLIQNNIKPQRVFLRSYNSNITFEASLIAGDEVSEVISGCLEEFSMDGNEGGNHLTIGYIYQKDANKHKSLKLSKNYTAFLFISNKTSSPDKWIM